MYIARQLKENNIAEYLLYMWQVEDIIRAYHCDLETLKENYLNQFKAESDNVKELEEWYGNLINMMRSEGVQESGHLQINKNVIINLTDLHNELLKSTKFPFYTAAYYKALPFIVELRNKGQNKDLPEIENCFNALYGIMLLKMQKKVVNDETTKAMGDISKLIAALSEYYQQEKKGLLKFE